MRLFTLALGALLPCLAAAPLVDKAKALGNPTAPLRLEVYSDYMCPHCKAFHDTVLSMGSVPLPVLRARIDRFIAEGGKDPMPVKWQKPGGDDAAAP